MADPVVAFAESTPSELELSLMELALNLKRQCFHSMALRKLQSGYISDFWIYYLLMTLEFKAVIQVVVGALLPRSNMFSTGM